MTEIQKSPARRRHHINENGGYQTFTDNRLRAARVLMGGSRHTPTTKEAAFARRMTHDGADIHEIHAALGWQCSLKTTRNYLRKLNIRPRSKSKRAARSHLGGETTIGTSSGPDFRPYRPRVRT